VFDSTKAKKTTVSEEGGDSSDYDQLVGKPLPFVPKEDLLVTNPEVLQELGYTGSFKPKPEHMKKFYDHMRDNLVVDSKTGKVHNKYKYKDMYRCKECNMPMKLNWSKCKMCGLERGGDTAELKAKKVANRQTLS